MLRLRLPGSILFPCLCILALGLIDCRSVLGQVSYQAGPDGQYLTIDQVKQFLLNAPVIKEKTASKGITAPSRLTLSDGTLTHDAGFQTIDESKPKAELVSGTEMNFRDSYKYNIAAYELAVLLGIDHMMPVTVVRKINGKTGSLTWWLKVQMDEGERMKRKIMPPNPEYWNEQMFRVRVFGQLVFDTDRNLTNLLIDPDWKLYMIDFSRAFRQYGDLRTEKDLVKCDKLLLEKLRKLDKKDLEKATKNYLTDMERKGLLIRRDKIVALFDKLVREKGEKEVLY